MCCSHTATSRAASVSALVLVGHQFCSVLCLKKNIPDIFDCNLKTNYHIMIIFGTNIPDTTCFQMSIPFPTSPSVCLCTTLGKQIERIVLK